MTIYFVAWPNPSAAYNNWCRHLEVVVNSDTRAFSQYLSADGMPNYSITNNEPIATFKKGMYAKYAIQQDEKGRRMRTQEGVQSQKTSGGEGS